jgi:hypothetical protein
MFKCLFYASFLEYSCYKTDIINTANKRQKTALYYYNKASVFLILMSF